MSRFIYLAGCVLFFIFGYAFDIKKLQKKVIYAKEQKVKETNILQNKTKMVSVFELKQEKTMVLQQRFASNFDFSDVLGVLEKVFVSSQVDFQLLEPQKTKEDGLFVIYPIRFEVSGKYQSLLELINNIFRQPYFIKFDELNIQSKSTGGIDDELCMQALITVYKNKAGVIEKQANDSFVSKAAIAIPKESIFIRKNSVVDKTKLFLWATSELSFLGFIKQNQIIYGFVSDPMGITYKVSVGDKIGLRQSKVVEIDADGIYLSNKDENIYRIRVKK